MSIIKLSWSGFYKTDNLKNNYWLLIFAAYLILLAITVLRHEPWMDEAQPWLLVNDFSIVELFTKYLRYDGHPGLWYLLVMIPAKLGLPYFSINVLSAIISALGVFLFLRYSPFPFFAKILFPFTYFTFYQYGVVARSYCLIPLLLFLIAIKFEKRIEQPVVYSLLLSLLANVSAHTWLIAGSLFFVHLFDVFKGWRQFDKKSRNKHILSAVIFSLSAILVVLTLAPPPPDQTFARYFNYSLMNFLISSKWMISGSLVMDESSNVIGLQMFFSFLILGATFLWLRQNKLTFLYLLPLLLNLILFAVKYRNLWHEGVLFFLWIFVLWVSYDKNKGKNLSFAGRTVLVLISLVFAVQVYWSAYAIRFEINNNYSSGYDVAQYIKENQLENKRIFISGWKSIAILPYFKENIFYNLNNGSKERIWFWSTTNQSFVGYDDTVVDAIQKDQPDVVIFASDHIEPDTKIELEGYKVSEFFEGYLCWKTGIYEPDSYMIFRKSNELDD